MWQVDTDKQHLERSFAYYHRGFLKLEPKTDAGYTGINAAYVLDLLAHIEERYASDVGTESATAPRTAHPSTREIREELVKPPSWARDPPRLSLARGSVVVPGDDCRSILWSWPIQLRRVFGWLKPKQWWAMCTVVGVRILSRTVSVTRPTASRAPPESASALKGTEAWSVLQEFLDDKADAVQTVFSGKFGLGLSGGGFRASLFHIGVLAKLAELDLLRHVHVLSCVSGGSIVGAYYYLELKKLLQDKVDVVEEPEDEGNEITREDYVAIVQRMSTKFLAGVQRNIRTRVVANLFANFKMVFSSRYSRTQRAGDLYERELYSLVADGGGDKRFMDDLLIRPKNADSFNPRTKNWIRKHKVPMLVLNATTLNTGHNWQFTATWMGESPFAVDPEIDGNWRYRRMYYGEAPEKYRRVRLGTAVGASACVPGLFEPIAMPDLYPKEEGGLPEMTVRLVDGGVHDNQGVASLLEQNCTAILVSDASGQMTSVPEPEGGVLGRCYGPIRR